MTDSSIEFPFLPPEVCALRVRLVCEGVPSVLGQWHKIETCLEMVKSQREALQRLVVCSTDSCPHYSVIASVPCVWCRSRNYKLRADLAERRLERALDLLRRISKGGDAGYVEAVLVEIEAMR